MIALVRLLVVSMIVLTIIYVCVSLYSRAVRRDRLKDAWETGDRDGDWDKDSEDENGPFQDWESYRQAGMARYDRSLRKKLILGIYVVPLCLMVFILYATNFM